jgi:benzoate 4-monooxygenase
MRIYSTSFLGLPRQILQGSASINVCGFIFHAEDVVLVPLYIIYYSTEIWGPDVEAFNPDCWTFERLTVC